MLPAPTDGSAPGFVALLRFRSHDVPVLVAQLRNCVALLSTKAGFINAHMARAIDESELIVLQLGWDTVGSYRRALSAYDVKVEVVPVMSQALDEPTAFEVLHFRDASGAVDSTGALAADADSVSLGSAAADYVPPAPS
ncbi:MAG: hypothetical protein B7C55_07765 [Actinomycetales bacterium mxb001]|nr:MAG: hypothetical protein B7C55_07765 [Actinomycetales bacterium mxb001]